MIFGDRSGSVANVLSGSVTHINRRIRSKSSESDLFGLR